MIAKHNFLILILLVLLLYVNQLGAQVRPDDLKKDSKTWAEWGILGGYNFEQLIAYPFSSAYSNGGTLGAYIKKRSNSFGITCGLTATSARYVTGYPAAQSFGMIKAETGDTLRKGDFAVDYLNIPIIIEYRPAKHFSLQMGFSYSYTINTTDENNAFTHCWNTDKVFKSSNVSSLAGFEFEFSQKIRFQATYSIGFLDINNLKFPGLTDQWRVSNGQLSLIYRIKKWNVKVPN